MSDLSGFIGLGHLGHPICQRLLERGFELAVYDLRPDVVHDLGAVACKSARDVAERCELIQVCVQTDDQCEEVVLGTDGLLAGARPGQAIAIHSTVRPDTVRELERAARERGVDVVDAPLAGRGPFSVRDGSFWILAGGDAAAIERFRPLFDPISARILLTGPVGTGSALKLAHNVMVYLSFLAAQEAADLARATGVRLDVLEAVASATGTLSERMLVYLEQREGGYARARAEGLTSSADLAVYAGILEKDLRDAIEVAADLGVRLPGAELAKSLAHYFFDPGAG